MKLRCASCGFELNLSIKSLPKNAKLYCPKCKNVLSPTEQEPSAGQQPNVTQAPIPVPPPPSSPVVQFPSAIPPSVNNLQPVPPPVPNILPSQPATPVIPEQQLFNEDIKPEFEITQSEEEVIRKREELFSKPEQVWYDSTAKPPPVPSVQNIAPPPVPVNLPPPIPNAIPPPIPATSQPSQSGYISASSSIQIDSSLVMPDNRPAASAPVITPQIQEERIELATESYAPAAAMDEQTVHEEKGDNPKSDLPAKTETADKKDVIILSSQPYSPRKISITIPAISLIVLAAVAGFIYYQIVVSSSKTDFIKDLKSTPSLGTLPAIGNKDNQNTATSKEESKANQNSSKPSNTKIPVKAKKSALEHYKKGNQYFMESKYEQARDEYAMAVAADPTFGLAYRGLGTTYAKLGQPDLAVKNYEKYIEVMPNASDAEQVKSIIKQYYGK